MFAIISDVHANLPALLAVKNEIRRLGIKRVLCLGDTLGYGPSPIECWREVNKLCELVLLGNHEIAIRDVAWSTFNHHAAPAAEWTRGRLERKAPKILEQMRQMSPWAEREGLLLVHGCPKDPANGYLFEDTCCTDEPWLDSNFQALSPGQICFGGHTHVPGLFMRNSDSGDDPDADLVILDDANTSSDETSMDGLNIGRIPRFAFYRQRDLRSVIWEICDGQQAIVNVGSVGMPRDYEPRASFVVFDPVRREIFFHRVEYDIEETVRLRNRAGLPDGLDERYRIGK